LVLDEMAAPSPATLAALRAALSVVAAAKGALVIDLRNNGGGSADMNDTLWSYFVTRAQPTAAMFFRSSNRRIERQVSPRQGEPRFDRVPIFLVTGVRTGSAAEGFALFLQESGRAKTVGARSVGAGHIVRAFRVDDNNIADISIGRVMSAKTGREWERISVQPDYLAPEAAALDSAQTLARAAAARALQRL
jgi:C-terminal processing protease CtpA/Prc